jgi:hypothetical protein
MLEVVIIGERSRSNENLKVINPVIIAQLKIVKAYTFWSVIETLCQRLVVRIESGGPSWPFIPHTLLTQSYKKLLTYLCQ